MAEPLVMTAPQAFSLVPFLSICIEFFFQRIFHLPQSVHFPRVGIIHTLSSSPNQISPPPDFSLPLILKGQGCFLGRCQNFKLNH